MVYFGKKSIGDLEALKQQIQALEQALNNTAKTNTANTFTEKQVINKTNTNDVHSLSIEYPDNKSGQIVFKEGGTVKAFIGKENPTQTQFIISNGNRELKLSGGNNNMSVNSSGLTARMDVEFGTRIKMGHGGALIRFTPEDSTLKTLQFYENNPTDSKRLMLKVATPTDNNHVTNKEYVDNRIKYVEKVGGLSFTKDTDIISGKLCKYWARVNYSDLGIPNGKTIISCNIAKPADSKSISLSFFPKNAQNQCLIEIFQYNETSDIRTQLNGLTYCFTYIN